MSIDIVSFAMLIVNNYNNCILFHVINTTDGSVAIIFPVYDDQWVLASLMLAKNHRTKCFLFIIFNLIP